MGLFSPNYAFLMIGRFLVGVGVGFTLMIVPVYTAEVSPTCPRCIHEISITIGIMLGYLSNFAFSKLLLWLGWRLMLGVGVFPSVLIPLGVLALPESPHWLVMRGRLGDAHRVLQKISDSKQEAQQRLVDIKSVAGILESCNEDVIEVINKKKSVEGVWKEMFITGTPAIRHIIVAIISIHFFHFFQQAVGLDSIILYSPTIFKKAGITSDREKLLATVAVGCTNTFFILVPMFLWDGFRFGRRAMLLTSFGGLTVSLFTLGTCLTAIGHSDKKVTWAAVLSIASMYSSVASFSIGAGPN
ncbi:hypothetical protein QN277_005012 [Acacia crassicarpa]|uniref:Major facilitator superfamily (MFS) profile domain-containing protein n=1 Tax=Acacia crassicarpa TaxID=499986 RepID=A0AAE1JVX6_9FABA|nr:hypothetical protein QN277_005012 [Acacia crassicarpa]